MGTKRTKFKRTEKVKSMELLQLTAHDDVGAGSPQGGAILDRVLAAASPIATAVPGASLVWVTMTPFIVRAVATGGVCHRVVGGNLTPIGEAVAELLTAGMTVLPAAARQRVAELLQAGLGDLHVEIDCAFGTVTTSFVRSDDDDRRVVLFRLVSQETKH
jgi:hypothetical protein